MSATPRSARLSSPGEVVAILVASAAVWVVLIAVLLTLFFAVLIPAVQFGGRDQLPGNFPVYPGSHLESAIASRAGECTTVEAQWSSEDEAARVVAFYQEQLSTGDWTVTDSRQSGTATIIYFKTSAGTNPNGYVSVESPPYSGTTQISVTIEKADGGTTDCQVVVGVVG